MNTIIVSLFVIVAVVSLVSTAPTKAQRELFNKMVQNSINFKCRDPQPRVVLISEVFGDKIESDKTYIPYMTVLHRCDNSGCCQPGYSCGAKTIEEVQLVIKAEKDKAHGRKAVSYVSVTAQNHTSCHCAEVGNTPK